MGIEQEIAALDRIRASHPYTLGWARAVWGWAVRHKMEACVVSMSRMERMTSEGVYRGA